MELLDTQKAEPRWLELYDGARVLAAPGGAAMVYAARARADALVVTLKEAGEAVTKAGGVVSGLPDLSDPADERGVWDAMFALSLGELAIVDWEGVTIDRKPVAFKPELVTRLLGDTRAADLFIARQMARHNAAVREGNA
ncbi:MAG TPA: hypothetical protein VGN80_19095 [Devosiaceae bacterium]|jgi:hypothetical protein|nr:hypothetical protein [Devosiaceae bacterium]